MRLDLIDAVVFLPLITALAMLVVPKDRASGLRWLALVGAIATFGFSLLLLRVPAGRSLDVSIPWIAGSWTAAYHVRVDGLSLFFVLLTTFISVPAIWTACSYSDTTRLRGYLMLLLSFETTLLGLFTAADLLLFYFYWDLMLIPVFLLLVGFADSAQARRAAWGYLIYNGAGGLVLLLGVIGLVAQTHTFEVLSKPLHLGANLQWWLFGAFAIAFLIKTPSFPFHAWMPSTYTEAPPPVVAMVAGVQSKAGPYGFLAFALPLFGDAARIWAPAMLTLAVCSVLYGAFTAIGQRDMKMLVAFTSLSHLGLVVLALFAFDFTSVPASILMIVSHGVIAAALFLLCGFVEERAGTRDLAAFSGLAAGAPRLAALMLIAAMAALGLPGLSGFAGEFLILIGAWQTQPVYAALTLPAIVLASVYMLRIFAGALHGPLSLPAGGQAAELRPREIAIVAPLVAAMFFLGIWPAWLNARTPSDIGIHAGSNVVGRAKLAPGTDFVGPTTESAVAQAVM